MAAHFYRSLESNNADFVSDDHQVAVNAAKAESMLKTPSPQPQGSSGGSTTASASAATSTAAAAKPISNLKKTIPFTIASTDQNEDADSELRMAAASLRRSSTVKKEKEVKKPGSNKKANNLASMFE